MKEQDQGMSLRLAKVYKTLAEVLKIKKGRRQNKGGLKSIEWYKAWQIN